MRFVLNIPPENVDPISRLIKDGKYRTVQDFVLTAILNQLYLEEETGTSNVSGAPLITETLGSSKTTFGKSKSIYQLLSPDIANVSTVPLPEPDRVGSRLDGLWNRLFPIKISTRVLANMLRGNGPTVPLERLQSNASSVARELGKLLLKKERDLGRKRTEMISTALPTRRNEFKARLRFESHFVGSLSKRTVENRTVILAGGAPATLRFMNITVEGSGQVVVGLTAAGLAFAKLPNPVMDQDEVNAPFSDEERHFLLDHIKSELPDETRLVRFALGLIKEGSNQPESLHSHLKRELQEANLNDTELVTLRTGLLSRMAELRLLTRSRTALSVKYQLTPEGETFLQGAT
jgi:hypothetical protein